MSKPVITACNGNNFSFVKDKSVDFVLTDPPFNISKETNFHTYEKNTIHSHKFDEKMEEQWDTVSHEEFLEQLLQWSQEWFRVLKPGGSFAVFCADSYVSHTMEAMKEAGLLPSRVFSWRKNNAVPVNRGAVPMSAVEYVITGVKKGKRTFNADVDVTYQSLDQKIIESTIVADKASTVLYQELRKNLEEDLANTNHNDPDAHLDFIGNTVRDVIQSNTEKIVDKVLAQYKDKKPKKNGSDGDSDNNADDRGKYLQACVPNYIQNPLKTGKRLHSTEKPVDLLKFFVALYSNTGDTILDSFSGSGSTAEAAIKLGRNTIAIEQDKGVYEASIERFTRLHADIEIFDGERTNPKQKTGLF